MRKPLAPKSVRLPDTETAPNTARLPTRAERIAMWGDPDDPSWAALNLRHGPAFTAHMKAYDAICALFCAWMDEGLFGNIIRIDRIHEAGNPNHEFGVSFDLNTAQNPLGRPAPEGTHGSVIPLVPTAIKHGFVWTPTAARHFELVRPAP